MRKIKAGKKWALDCKVVGREGDIVTVNINKGAIFVFKMLGDYIAYGCYDGLGGPRVNFDQLYIWNSTETNSNGKIKKTFTIHKKDLEEIINE